MKYPLFLLLLVMTIFSSGFAVALDAEKAQATFAVH